MRGMLGQTVKDAAWFYPEPKTDKAEVVRDRVAFCEYLGSLMGLNSSI